MCVKCCLDGELSGGRKEFLAVHISHPAAAYEWGFLLSMWHTLHTKEESEYVKICTIHSFVIPGHETGSGISRRSDAACTERHH